MAERFRLDRARVLLSNDDGINATGLKTLERVAKAIFREVWVVAPETEQSASSHSLTLRRPLRIRRISKHRYAVDGTPTDSVLLGVQEVMRETPPDIVLSGINRGGNLGEDVTYSGTVAAAMEGALLGIPSVALSQVCIDRRSVRWRTAEHWLPTVLMQLVDAGWPSRVLINVNFPDVAAKAVNGFRVVPQGRRKIGGTLQEGTDPRGGHYFWIGAQRDEVPFKTNSDLSAVREGEISITPLGMDLTHTATLKRLKTMIK
jgi:5'-nucleotidase